jgi:preprotein translocase subunit SecA
VDEIDRAEKMKEEGGYVKELGGLHVIGTERHEARRIDLQLRGRCGRQGDPGSSRFYLSLEDDLMRIFAGPWVKTILEKLGMKEGERIESKLVTRRIEAAQKKVEERNFEVRKNLLEYDEVMDEQRKRVYRYRQQILDGINCRSLIAEMIEQQVDFHIDAFLNRDYGVEAFAGFVANRFGMAFEARDFRGMDFQLANDFARDQAERLAETHVLDAIEENLPGEEDEGDWNWEALAKFANARWGLNLRDRDLKRVGRDEVAQLLIDKAREAIAKVDLSEGAPLLDEKFGVRTTVAWVKHKFGLGIDLDTVLGHEPPELKKLICAESEKCYDIKEH